MSTTFAKERTLQDEIAPAVESRVPGVEVLAVELPSPSRIRVYIDREDGVDHALCERVTHAPMPTVPSTPSRCPRRAGPPLRKPEHFAGAVGARVGAGRGRPKKPAPRASHRGRRRHHHARGRRRRRDPHPVRRGDGHLRRQQHRHAELDGSATPANTVNQFTGDITRTDDSNALRGLSDGNFHSWAIGLRAVVPIGYRLGYTQIRQAQLELARDIEILKDQELKVQSYLANYYRRLSLNYEQIRANRAYREAFAEQFRPDELESAGRPRHPDQSCSSRSASWRTPWRTNTTRSCSTITPWSDGSLPRARSRPRQRSHRRGRSPECAAVRAVEHQAQRTAAIVLRERAAPTPLPIGDGSMDTVRRATDRLMADRRRSRAW